MQKFHDLKIRTRLAVLFLILALLPLLAALGVFYWAFTSSHKDKICTYSQQIMRQMAQNVASRMSYLSNASIEIEFSGVVQQTLQMYDQMSEWQLYKAQEELAKLSSRKFYTLGSVSDVLIYTPQQQRLLVYGNPGMKLNLQKDYLQGIFARCWAGDGAIIWDAVSSQEEDYMIRYAQPEVPGDKAGILLTRMIRSLDDGRNLGYLVIRANESILADVYREAELGTGTQFFVLNSRGHVITSSNPELRVSDAYPDPELLSRIEQTETDGNTKVFDYKDCFASFYPVEGTDWYMVCLIPYSYIYANAVKAFLETGVIVLLGFLAALGLACRFSTTLLGPLQHLRQAMQSASRGNLQVLLQPAYNDEIGELTQYFNAMLQDIQELIGRVRQHAEQKRKAELQALQAQIHPHFLSNTLNTVRFLARAQNAYNIEEITTSLIHMFQFMTSQGDAMVTVQQEIEYIKAYVNVQEYRYLDKFSVTYEIEPDIAGCMMPKMLLQPLVENALIHGIEPMEGQGLISLKGYRDGEQLKFVLTDNGVGMEPETLAHLLDHSVKEHHRGLSGIGFANVNERIQLHFGPAYGLQAESVEGFYTRVEMTLPVVAGGKPYVQDFDC